MDSVIWIVVAVIVMVLLLTSLLNNSFKANVGRYKRRDLMTANEKEFFGRLISALPGHFVFPQVAMSAIIEASATRENIKQQDRLRVAQQRVDYLICDSACVILAVIELDDRTHNKKKDDIRDARLAQGHIPTIRFESRQKPSLTEIAAAISKIEEANAAVAFLNYSR